MPRFTLPAKLCVLVLSVLCSTAFAAEPPYKEGELGDKFALTPAQLRTSLSDLRRIMRSKRQPAGTVFECYQSGAASFDEWLEFPPRAMTSPPDGAPSYYRFVYRDGYPVASYRHEGTSVRLSRSYYYDQRFFPVLSVMSGKDGKTLFSCLLVYDSADRIKRVTVFDAEENFLRAMCFRHPGGPGVMETWRYDVKGQLVSHYLYTPEEDYRIENGEKIRQNNKLRLLQMNELAKYGVRPIYPAP